MLREDGASIGLTIASSDTENPDADTSGEADWEEIFVFLVNNSTLTHWDIPKLTIPQVEVYMTKLGRYMSLKMGIPPTDQPKKASGTGAPSTKDDLMAIAAAFNGIG